MTQVPFVDLSAQYASIAAEVGAAINGVLTRGDFVLGRAVSDFEAAFAQFVGCEHGVGVASGLDALRLSLIALGIGPGDEVILPANTYIATALAVSEAGARPVLVDCQRETFNINAALVEAAITPQTKAVIPVHLTGQAADMDPILEVAGRRRLQVVEDACQAHGTRYKGRSCGSLGIAGCFSFYPGKNLGAYGDGGLITTRDAALAENLRRLRNYGQKVKYEHVVKGTNSRLDTMQAAILQVKLKRLAAWNSARAAHAARYHELLAGVGDLALQQVASFSTHIYHLFIVRTARRNALQSHLQAHGIQTGIHYPIPIHLQKAYADLGYSPGDFPQSEKLANEALSLPMFPELREEQLVRVAQAVKAFFDQARS